VAVVRVEVGRAAVVGRVEEGQGEVKEEVGGQGKRHQGLCP
jgi:hypothetical protein